MQKLLVLMIGLIFAVVVTACEQGDAGDSEPTPETPFQTIPAAEADEIVGEPAGPDASPTAPYALDPQLWLTPGVIGRDEIPMIVSFNTPDGVTVDGRYFPAGVDRAPLVVLMHQFNHQNVDQWEAFGYWLNNRGDVEAPTGEAVYQDPAWFPDPGDGFQASVLTFPFRGCEEAGCQNANRDHAGWIADATGAVRFGIDLPGVDPERAAVVGTSIGADAAVEACMQLLQQGFYCAGVLAVSPGNFLDNDFNSAAEVLVGEGIPVWCYAAREDQASAEACGEASGEGYRAILVDGSAHGIQLADPNITPNLPEVILEFLQTVVSAEE